MVALYKAVVEFLCVPSRLALMVVSNILVFLTIFSMSSETSTEYLGLFAPIFKILFLVFLATASVLAVMISIKCSRLVYKYEVDTQIIVDAVFDYKLFEESDYNTWSPSEFSAWLQAKKLVTQ